MNPLFVRGLEIQWDLVEKGSYLRNIKALKSIKSLNFSKPIVFFVGENGSGKSTLLEAMAIALGFNPEGGSKNYSFSSYDSHSDLYKSIKIIKGFTFPKWGYFLRAESFYNVASQEEEYAKTGGLPSQDYHKKSHGESFFQLLYGQIREMSLYFLDEPEAALSPRRQMEILKDIEDHSQKGCQFFISTHLPLLLSMKNSQILSFDNGKIKEVGLKETGTYKIYRDFVEEIERQED